MSNQPGIRLYNTLTRQKEAFKPIDASNVRMYACGPTVYDFAHIGNARPIIVFDVLFRLLRNAFGEEHVKYVRNITDVDDKINARAASEGVSIEDVTSRTTKQFHADIAALGVLEPSVEPRATDHIEEMKDLIETLVARGHAYVADDHALFDVASMADYGALSNRSLDEMIAGARVEVASYKKNPTDFVLWKPSRDGEPSWESPSGISANGRPGWHIECSAMAAKHLGETFDIHGGGIDLTFPHHENEVAQSRCAHGTDVMANVWMHNGFVQVEGEKMSKSLGNFITINDLLETEKFGGRRWPGEVLRLAMLMSHYRQPIDWTVQRLEEAEQVLNTWYRTLVEHKASPEVPERIMKHIRDDLNIHEAVGEVFTLAKQASNTTNGESSSAAADAVAALNMLGFLQQSEEEWFSFSPSCDSVDLSEVQSHINARLNSIAEKDWTKADEIRDELLSQGIQLKDGKDPETGARTTTWEVKR
ncbi:MAG: cysteine--tRNA ligase [Hyphomicrobiales bacterium]